ncbi:MAG TPA: MBOAT family protein, partial [Arcobacter sp.]|nr:MBOAT family protein [Arcobacter sp.]
KVSKKTLLITGISINIIILGYFKYYDFFIRNLNFALGTTFSELNLLLPLAISFFTFQQIAYLVDSYHSETKEYSLLNYMVFVSFFPQLIAGPIVHHKEMMPQFSYYKSKFVNYRNIVLGLFIFSIGLFKKVVIADTFASWATHGFDNSEVLNFFEAWATSLSYTFQIYFDFSGYTDMAIGLALLFNIRIPSNFNSPYKATNIQSFWRRWHITLSNFLRDYIYIPLGGNREGDVRLYMNLIITFLIGGIWHGAGWTFIFWGLLHGMALVVFSLWNKLHIKLYSFVGWLITFMFINITWVFFRAEEWSDAMKVLSGMFGFTTIAFPVQLSNSLSFLKGYGVVFIEGFLSNMGGKLDTIVALLVGFILVLGFKNSNQLLKEFKLSHFNLIFVTFIFSIALLAITRESEFLYFNF